jgi:Bacterial Ig domain
MNTRSIAWASMSLSLLAAFVLLMTSCGPMGAATAVSSGSLRAWIDQPITGYTLPMQELTLKAHARQDGGGVTEIHFMVNDTLLANVPADSSQELTSASTTWNPSAEGWYNIQAIAFNAGGQQAMSEVSHICISQSEAGPCPVVAAVSGEVDSTIKVGASPDPVSIGAQCNPEDRIVNFEAYVADTGGAIEEDIHAYLVGASGERWEFFVPLTPGTTAGSYVGTYDLGTAYDAVLGGADGTLEYTLVLLNEAKEMFRTSETKTLTLHYCGAVQPVQGVVKVMGTPELVFIGKCTPSAIDFVAETDIDPGMYDRVDLRYVWWDWNDAWVGTTPPADNSSEMTRDASGAWRYHMDVNTAPAAMSRGGKITFRAAVVNTDNVDIVYSEVSAIVIKPCGGGGVAPPPQYSCRDFDGQEQQCLAMKGCHFWTDKTCRQEVESQALPCSAYTGEPNQCKAQPGCNLWSDGTCSDQEEPYIPPPSCDAFNGNPGACKSSGYCWAWSDDTCRDYEEPYKPPSCAEYLKPDECNAAGCSWDDKMSVCY